MKKTIIAISILFAASFAPAEEITLKTILPGGDTVRGRKGAIGVTYKDLTKLIDNVLIVEGLLGIGTSSPGRGLLEVAALNGNDWPISIANSKSSSDVTLPGLTLSRTDVGSSSNYTWIIGMKNTAGDIFFRADFSGSSSWSRDTFFMEHLTGNVGIGTTSPVAKLDVAGETKTTGISGLNLPDGTALISSGRLTSTGSSVIYKTNIKPLQDDFYKILKVDPKTFVYKSSGINGIGYIAEDFDALGLKNLVFYSKAGLPDSIAYEKLSLYSIEILKDHEKEIKELKAENEAMRARVAALEARTEDGRR